MFRLWYLYRVIILVCLFPIVKEVFPIVLTAVEKFTDMTSTNELPSLFYFLKVFIFNICTIMHDVSHNFAAIGRFS